MGRLQAGELTIPGAKEIMACKSIISREYESGQITPGAESRRNFQCVLVNSHVGSRINQQKSD